MEAGADALRRGGRQAVSTREAKAAQGVSGPEPAPVRAEAERTPHHDNAAPVGKVFFDSPQGPSVCSGTVAKDVNHPGEPDLVWAAGHRVHADGDGGWYRDIVFVPASDDLGRSEADLTDAGASEIAP